MALAEDPEPQELTTAVVDDLDTSPRPAKTVSYALALLRSLKPRLDAILGEETQDGSTPSSLRGFPVVLDFMDILRPTKPSKSGAKADSKSEAIRVGSAEDVWANVLYLAPRETGVNGIKLQRLSDLVSQTFKDEGYITESRPLKVLMAIPLPQLHCTVLNTSMRRPSRFRGQPFCYTDILHTLAITPPTPESTLTSSSASASQAVPGTSTKPIVDQKKLVHPAPVPLSLALASSTASFAHPPSDRIPQDGDTGHEAHPESDSFTVDVSELGLWIMGSRAPDGGYVSCGGVSLGSGMEV
ncbi:hypothetical protein DXG03_002990 [Asterophora parasitica]|uniref:Uncharacterized protein n=1 Tax=Asterophora parasitica TaxID=117018 RepID=A0A9P7G8B5_9AGAR|nr:hypothetical protein DXG03_002990 [Asterophora parasitica]